MTQLAPQSSPRTSEPIPPRKKNSFGWKGIIIGIVIGVILTNVLGRGGDSSAEQDAVTTAETEEVSVPQTPSRAVTAIEVQPQAIAKTLEVVGTVAAADLISVTSPRTGLQITNLLVDEGDFVQAGQVLAQLNNDTLRAELLQAKAQEA